MSRVPFFGLMVCTRTSRFWDSQAAPCDEAELVPYVRVDRLGIDNPFDDKRWMVWIENEWDLQEFCEKYGKVILSINTLGSEPCYEIEIDDDYRE